MFEGAQIRLNEFARVALLDAPTPLNEVHLPEVSARGLRLFLKRDDLGGIGGGGNKLRKLEVMLAGAKEDGVDTLITFGALQSNHARLTAAVAARLGMRCELILSRRVPGLGAPYEQSGNLLLSELFGARLHILSADEDALAYGQALAVRLESEERRAQIIPFGGSNREGAIGMARVSVEIAMQLDELGLRPGQVIAASGSGGTQAGLATGLQLCCPDSRVTGISILHDAATLSGIVAALQDQVAATIGQATSQRQVPVIDDRFVGAGYGIPYSEMLETIRAFARRTGIILDPVYTGKAMHGLLQRIAEGQHDDDEVIVFLHTGGLPGVFAYSDSLATQSDKSEVTEYA